jgi:hypothetical protein
MGIKSFEVCYKGSPATIEYETELTFGETEGIIQQSIDLSDINKPKIKLKEFRMAILLKTIKKAPWQVGNANYVNAQPNAVINQVLEHIMQDYPLADFLGEWMTSFMGSTMESDSVSESTPTVQSDSDGPKEKQTSTKQGGSKSSSHTVQKT